MTAWPAGHGRAMRAATPSCMSPMTAALWLMQAGISPSDLLPKLWMWRYKWTLWPHNTTCLPMPNCSAWPAPIPSPSMNSPTIPAPPTSAEPKLFGEYQPKRLVLPAAQTPSCHRHDGTIGTVDARKPTRASCGKDVPWSMRISLSCVTPTNPGVRGHWLGDGRNWMRYAVW